MPALTALNLLPPFDRAPDFVNEKGVKWWSDADTTRYARRKTSKGQSLPTAQGWLVEEPSGSRTRLLVDNGKIIAESPSLEGIGTRIELLKALLSDTSPLETNKMVADTPKTKTKKLTASQAAVLGKLAADGPARYYDAAKVGGTGTTLSWLVARKLALVFLDSGKNKIWQITDAGKSALQAGRTDVLAPAAGSRQPRPTSSLKR